MNNNIFKSMRRSLLFAIAATVVIIGFTACSEDTIMTQDATAPANSYKVVIPANMGGKDTRAIAYNSETGGYDATFETTDYIFVFNLTKNAEGRKKEEDSDWWEPTHLRPDANGKTANLVGELAFAVYDEQTGTYTAITPEVDDELMLFYNINQYLYYSRSYPDGYNDKDIADYAIAKVKITSIDDGVIKTERSSFWNPQSIYKINFTGIASDIKIKKVLIQSNQNKLVSSYEPTRLDRQEFFGNVSYDYGEAGTDQREQIFMLRFADPNDGNEPIIESAPGDEITFMALGSDGNYYIGSKTITTDVENGKYYQAELAMGNAGLAMTLTNHTTEETVVVVDSWTQIYSKDAAYTLENTGYDNGFNWYGGVNTLTLKNVSLSTRYNAILVYTEKDDIDNTKNHYLVLDGENTLNCAAGYYMPDALVVGENCSLYISETSADSKLNMTTSFSLNDNSTATIESGVVNVNGYLALWGNATMNVEGGVLTAGEIVTSGNGCCKISKSGKVRIPMNINIREGLIKAASGYILNTAKEDDYTVYKVTAADPYEEPKALSSATAADLGKIIGSDGNVHVLNWDLPEGVRPVAMISSISSTGHGLALALERIRVNDCESFTWDASDEPNNGKTAIEILQAWSESNSVTFGTWRFATEAEWQQMVLNFQINGDAIEAGDDMVAEGLVAKLKQTGIFRDYLSAWTGETGDEEDRWISIYIDNRLWDEESQDFYMGPFILKTSRWCDPRETHNILPALEF